MKKRHTEALWTLMGNLFKSHPWHGVPIGDNAPEVVTAYIEVVPTDTVKYELEKITGHLTIDRPQKYSNVCPCLYGLIPQTYCGESVAEFSADKIGRETLVGDQDPLDICVLTEKVVSHADILLQAIPIGGFRMIDGDEADDKIIAVLKDDGVFGNLKSVHDCPQNTIDRLHHYFLTYKDAPNDEHNEVEITHIYDREEAYQVIQKSQEDYHSRFGQLESMLSAALHG